MAKTIKTASGTSPTYPADFADTVRETDVGLGDQTTYDPTGGSPTRQTSVWDLGSAQPVDRVRAQAYGTSWTVSRSDDASTWTTVGSSPATASSNAWMTVDLSFASTSARYWRLVVDSTGAGNVDRGAD